MEDHGSPVHPSPPSDGQLGGVRAADAFRFCWAVVLEVSIRPGTQEARRCQRRLDPPIVGASVWYQQGVRRVRPGDARHAILNPHCAGGHGCQRWPRRSGRGNCRLLPRLHRCRADALHRPDVGHSISRRSCGPAAQREGLYVALAGAVPCVLWVDGYCPRDSWRVLVAA